MKTCLSGSSFLLPLFLLCLLGQRTSGEVVFDNFGPNDSYDGGSGRSINWVVESPGSSFNMGMGTAARFQVSGGSYFLSSITLAMGNIYFGGTNNLAISIRADNGGLPTGSLLETVVVHPTDLTADYLVVTYPSSLEPVLIAGGNYWLIAEPADLNLVNGENNAAFDWYWSGTLGFAGNRQFNFTTEGWYDWQVFPNTLVPAFRIEGTVVPEPGTLSLLLVGLGLVAFRGWKRLQAVPSRPNENVSSARWRACA